MLTLTIISAPASDTLEARYCQLPKEGGVIGRSERCVLQLPDTDCMLSRQHARFIPDDEHWFVEDTSSNGLFMNDEQHPLGRGNQRRLMDGDTMRLGSYSLLVSTGLTGIGTEKEKEKLQNNQSEALAGETVQGALYLDEADNTVSQNNHRNESPATKYTVTSDTENHTPLEKVEIPAELMQIPVLHDQVDPVQQNEQQMQAMLDAVERLLDELSPDRMERRLKCEEPLWRRSGGLWHCYERYFGRMRREGEYLRLFRLWYRNACQKDVHNSLKTSQAG